MQIPYDKFQTTVAEGTYTLNELCLREIEKERQRVRGRGKEGGRERAERERGGVNIMGRREPLLIHHSREIVKS